MPRVTTVIVSDYQRDRVQRSDFYRGESRTYTVEFRGVLPDGVYIASSKWQVFNPAITVISDATGGYTSTSVTLTAGYPGCGVMTCTAVLTNGSIVNQQILIDVLPSPWYTGDIVNQGPQSLIVQNPSPLVTVLGDLPNGQVGESTSYQFTATGGTGPYTFGITSGALPAGLSMSTSGLVSGTRTTIGDYTFTVQATDSVYTAGRKVDESVTVSAPLPPVVGKAILVSQYNNLFTPAAIDNQPLNQWYFLTGTIDRATGFNQLRVNGSIANTQTFGGGPAHPAFDITVGNSSASTAENSVFTGLMWGAGVINGDVSDAEAAYLYNNGQGRRFYDISIDPDPVAVGLWSRVVYAWQLNDDAGNTNYLDAKGNKNLTKTGTVSNFLDPVFGKVAYFPANANNGCLRAHGSYGLLAPRKTYFAWALPYRSTVDPNHVFTCCVVSYDGVSDNEGLNINKTYT